MLHDPEQPMKIIRLRDLEFITASHESSQHAAV
jgi:hypothetical protein